MPDSTMISPDQAAGKFVVFRAHTGPGVPQAQQVNRGAMLAATAAPQASRWRRWKRSRPRRSTSSVSRDDPARLAAAERYDQLSRLRVRECRRCPRAARRLTRQREVGAAGKTVHGAVAFVEIASPGAERVAILPGSDAKLKGEYVAIGAHNDHVGFDQTPVDHDSLRAFNDAVRKLELAAPNHRVTPAQIQQIQVNVDSLHRIHPRAEGFDLQRRG